MDFFYLLVELRPQRASWHNWKLKMSSVWWHTSEAPAETSGSEWRIERRYRDVLHSSSGPPMMNWTGRSGWTGHPYRNLWLHILSLSASVHQYWLLKKRLDYKLRAIKSITRLFCYFKKNQCCVIINPVNNNDTKESYLGQWAFEK